MDRYFTAVIEAKFGILTNGIEYRFFTDIDDKNIMDKKPFFTFDLENLQDRDVEFLENFAHDKLNIDYISKSAETKKCIAEVKYLLKTEMENPSTEFAKLIAAKIVTGKKNITKTVYTPFFDYIKKAFKETILYMASEEIKQLQKGIKDQVEQADKEVKIEHQVPKVVTTEKELQGYYIIKSILAEIIPLEDIQYKDMKSYFTINYKGYAWKWICRLSMDGKTKALVLNTGEGTIKEEKLELNKVEEIYQYREKIKAVACRFSKSGKM